MSEKKSYRQHPNFKTAERNRAYYELLIKSGKKYQLWEWLLTILFYSALHYVKTFLAVVHQRPPNTITSHSALSVELSRLKRKKQLPKSIQRNYEKFRNYSRIARYHYLESYGDWNDPDFVQLVQVDCVEFFNSIRKFVLHELETAS
ncbi:MAG: hypothetical protein D6813_03740 [Calditrichaeota bacterium]|nr:MAG: hypothetical protein D6813_03740 [Calditrichota bacterium]